MLSPRKTLQILVPNPPMMGSPMQKVIPDMDHKLKIVLMALEIERLHRVAIHITDKYNDKIEQLLTTQQLLNDKIENQEEKISALNQQLLLKDDFINEIFEVKSPDDMNKKLVQQFKQVTNQLNRAKKQIETLNEMNIIFKRNPPESPELIDRIKQLESDYETMLQKKEQEITYLKIRNSSYDHSDSHDYPEINKLQSENQFLNDRIQELYMENEKLKNISRRSSIRDSSPPVRLITRVIHQEPFNAFSDFQLLHSRPSSFHVSPQPKRTPKQNAPEFETNLRKIQQLQKVDQFTADTVLQQIRLIATLLHLKRMELPDDLKDTKVTYLNQIETTNIKPDSKPDLASTVKPKKLFTFDDGENTQEKQQRSQSIRSNISKPTTKNQFIQVDFYDRKLLDKVKSDYNEMKRDYEQLQKLLKQATNESNQKVNQFNYDDMEEQSILNPKLVDNSCQVSLLQLRDIETENEILKNQIMQQEKLNINLKSQNTRQLDELNKNKQILVRKDDEIAILKNKKPEQIIEIPEGITSCYQQNNLELQILNLENELYEYQTKIQLQQDKINELQNNQEELNLQLRSSLQNLEDENLNLSGVQGQLSTLESQNKILQGQVEDLQQENKILQNQLNYLSDELNKNEPQKDQLDDQTQQLLHLMQITKDELKQKQIDLEQLQSQNDYLLQEMNQLKVEQENGRKQFNQVNTQNQQLQQLNTNLKLDNQNKSIQLDQLQFQNKQNQEQIDQLKLENQHYQQVLKDQEIEYETQLSQIRFRISVLEEQKLKEHSINISESEDKKQSDFSVNNSIEIKKNVELEAQVRKLLDEKYILFDQMQKQTADFKAKITKLNEEYDFQKLQLEEKIKELESRIVVYIDGDEKLIIENQNLANQIMNLTNQLSLTRQQTKSTKTMEQSPRNDQLLKEKDQLIAQLQKNYENLQRDLESVQLEKAELANQMQELQNEVIDAANQQYNYNQEISDIKEYNQGLKLQIQQLSKQLDQQRKQTKIEQEQQLQLDQLKNRKTNSQSTQFDTDIIFIDQSALKQKDDIIYALKKQLQIKEIELSQVYDNIRVANLEYARLEEQFKKQRAAFNQETQNRNAQERQYQQSALYQTRQNRILTQSQGIRCSNSEEHKRAASQSKSQEKLWKSKYEKVLQEMYQKESTQKQYKEKYDQLLMKFNTLKSNSDHTEELNTRLKQIVDQLQISLLETKSSINSSQNHESCLKREQALQQELQRLKYQSEQFQLEITELKNKPQEALPQNQDIIYNLKQRIFSLEIETQKLCKQIIEKDEQLKYTVKQNYQLEQLRVENSGLLQQIDQLKYQNSQLQEKERQAYSFQIQQQQQLISELDGKCHALLTELNELKGEYQRFSFKFSNSEFSKQGNSFNITNRLEIMNNLDVIRQELKTYQSKCSMQENELTQLRLQLQQPYQSQQLQKKVVNVRSFREQDEYLTEIITDLEVTKFQNENLRKLNAELQEQQTSLLKEIDKIKKQLGVFSPKGQQPISPRIEENLYSPRNARMRDSNGKQSQIEQLRSELDGLKQQVFSTSSSHCIKEAEKLSLQARVLTLEQQMKNVQNSLEKIQILTQENQDLRIQVRMLKETNSRMQQIVIQKTQPNDLTQVERLNRELTEKISELTQLKIKYKQALSTVQRMENKLM